MKLILFKKKFLLAFFLICFLTANSQNIGLSWARSFGSTTTEEYGKSVSYDAAGNVYTTGYFYGTVDFDPGPGTFGLTAFGGFGYTDVFVTKFDASGNFVWAKQIGGTSRELGLSVANDAAGNVYIAGWFDGTCDFDPGLGTYTLSPGWSNIAGFLCKLDPNGNFQWVKKVDGSGGDVIANHVSFDGTGNIYVTGFFEGGVDFDPGPGSFYLGSSGWEDAYIWKLDATGNFILARGFGDPLYSDESGCVTIDALGNMYISGYFQGTADFDPGPGTFTMTSGGQDVFISKLDVSGNFVWAKQITSSGPSSKASIKELPGGNILFTGNYGGGADLDPGPGTYTTGTNLGGIFYVTLDPSGNFVWARSIDNSFGGVIKLSSTALDASGNIYSTGSFYGTVDFDMGPGINAITGANQQDIYILKTDINGNFLTVATMTVGSSSQGLTSGYSIKVDNGANIYVTGYFDALTDFDPGPYLDTVSAVSYKGDVFVLKLNSCTLPTFSTGAINGSTVACPGTSLTYSIPPASGALFYIWNFPTGWTGTSTTNVISVVAGNSGTISVTAANSCGYSLPQTFSVTINSTPTLSIAATSNTICAGSSLTLSASGANTYTWSTSGVGSSVVVNPTVNITYSVTGTDLNGCLGTTSKSITVKTTPTPYAGTTASLICAGQTTTLYAVAADTYSWTGLGSGSTQTINPSVTTTYTLTGTLLNGCSATTTVTQYVSACTGISVFTSSNESLFVYPNPFNDYITINHFEEITTIEIIDVLGRVVLANSETKRLEFHFETATIPKGIYYLKATSDNKAFIHKIIKD